jgi:acyl-CoA thioester hydrolase
MAAVTRRFVHRLRVRYHECDLQGVVFNANYLAYFDIAVTEFMRETLGSYEELRARGLDMLVVEASVSYRSPARFDDEIDIAFVPAPLGRSSMVSHVQLERAGELIAFGRVVHVFVDVEAHTKVEIPPWVREGVDPWTAPAPEPGTAAAVPGGPAAQQG